MPRSARIWLIYVVLLLFAVPWYWNYFPGATRLWWGMPLWVVASLAGSAVVSCYTAWLLWTPWTEDSPSEVES